MPPPKRPKESKGDKAIVAAAGVDNTFRRTWDADEYEDKAAAREEKVPPSDQFWCRPCCAAPVAPCNTRRSSPTHLSEV